MKSKEKILVIGSSYVGFANGLSLARKNEIIFYDIDKEKIKIIDQKKSPISDDYYDEYVAEHNLSYSTSTILTEHINEASFIMLCVPTNYDENLNFFDTSILEEVIEQVVDVKSNAVIIIKSTIPVGFVEGVRRKYRDAKIIFSPEFLREDLQSETVFILQGLLWVTKVRLVKKLQIYF